MYDQYGHETFIFFLNIELSTNIWVNRSKKSTSYSKLFRYYRKFEKSILFSNIDTNKNTMAVRCNTHLNKIMFLQIEVYNQGCTRNRNLSL